MKKIVIPISILMLGIIAIIISIFIIDINADYQDYSVMNNGYQLFCIKLSPGMKITDVENILLMETGEYHPINTSFNSPTGIIELDWEKVNNLHTYPNIFLREKDGILSSVILQHEFNKMDVLNMNCSEVKDYLQRK